ncbi:hypothetical protein J2T14_004988 [Paenibacillus harenae]|nr:hypothetical protein [Paenibacillus harenae]
MTIAAITMILPLALAGCGNREPGSGTGSTQSPTETETGTRAETNSGAGWRDDHDINDTNDVIAIHNSVSNWEKLDTFTELKPGTQRIVHYTIEGDPIFYDLKYSDSGFQLRYDTTADKFGSPSVKVYDCKGFEKSESDVELRYTLTGCQGDNDEFVVLELDYNVAEQDLFEFTLLYGITEKNEVHTAENKLVKDLQNGEVAELDDFKLTSQERGLIYKEMVLANYLAEKKLSSTCNAEPHASYDLTVRINGGERHYEWSECNSGEDNETMTKMVRKIIAIVEGKNEYKALPAVKGAYE